MTGCPLPEVGQRVRVAGLLDDPDPLPVGTTGTVLRVHHVGGGFDQVSVAWDTGRRLLLIWPEDADAIVTE